MKISKSTYTTIYNKRTNTNPIIFCGSKNEKNAQLTKLFDRAQNIKPQPIIYSYKPSCIEKLTNINFQKKNMVLGITGESASGKSFITGAIIDSMIEKGLSLTHISCDDYHKDMSKYFKKYGDWPQTLLAGEDFEGPNGFYIFELQKDIKKLQNGKPVKTPYYDFVTGVSSPKVNIVKPERLILVEGIVSYYTKLNDLNIYVDCNETVRLQRALARAEQRGFSREGMLAMWEIIKKSAQHNIIPLKKDADIIVNGEMFLSEFKFFLDKMVKILRKGFTSLGA